MIQTNYPLFVQNSISLSYNYQTIMKNKWVYSPIFLLIIQDLEITAYQIGASLNTIRQMNY